MDGPPKIDGPTITCHIHARVIGEVHVSVASLTGFATTRVFLGRENRRTEERTNGPTMIEGRENRWTPENRRTRNHAQVIGEVHVPVASLAGSATTRVFPVRFSENPHLSTFGR